MLFTLSSLVLASFVAAPCLASSQAAFSIPGADDSDNYEFKWPVQNVAIIGAGVSGLMAYRELTRAGLQAHIFERDRVPGGNWYYSEETPLDAPIPSADIAVGDFVPSLPPAGVELPYTEEYKDNYTDVKRGHRGPKPLWDSLHSNAPAPLQQITDFPWPVDINWELSHYQLGKYLRSFASFLGLNSNDENPDTSYNTRVERVDKYLDENGNEHGWRLLLKKLVQTDYGTLKATWYTQVFDAVVVATGRYNAPHIPPIAGLPEVAQVFPDRLTHSRQYRHPESYASETILIVGASVSGAEISRNLNLFAKKIYQSIRPDKSDAEHIPVSALLGRIPSNTTIVPEIKRFLPPTGSDFSAVQIELVNGTILTGIDRVIFATGFRYSFPFLPQYHNSSIGLNDTVPTGELQPIVTDGTHIRSLHLDIFYIDDPTLCFIDMNVGMQSFTYSEYLSVAFSKVWTKKAFLPSRREMWRMHEERVKDRGGYGRYFQFLGAARTDENIRYFMAWLNTAAAKYGGRKVDSLPRGTSDIGQYWIKARYGDLNFRFNFSALQPMGVVDTALDMLSEEERSEAVYDAVFGDWW
ncbi:FAD/NAD(P)-binding domain-containing protein [Sparassis latifolia]